MSSSRRQTPRYSPSRAHFSTQYISGLQKQQNDLSQSYACQDPNFTDFRTNQQWLKNTVWQLTNGATPSSDDNSFYNGDMARDLLINLASAFPNQGMDIVNTGLIEKLIEVSFSLTEFLSIQPASRDPFAIGPREYLTQILTSVGLARSGEHRFLPLLMSKLVNMASVDIFDGFGNAGMAQPPMQMMDNEYVESKYALDMNNRTPESNAHSNHTPPGSGSDMSNSFVPSPDMMSPTGMEYSHGSNLTINTFGVNSMQDMVSPVGPSPQHMHMRQSLPMNNMVMRQGFQGEFHSMPTELDFNSLR
ncbi:hypothetical protein NLG97_g10087 [Lecanicillium saksenae]|uniref:Uncharacterized protein n=1 Tax=Lecanicillium saksenae TaxID=468837 RepID=A0ACC1QE60_9HYPO|nr:hypothetical protein NLG97_g10087 [Lecanicillium saksenae]